MCSCGAGAGMRMSASRTCERVDVPASWPRASDEGARAGDRVV